jgi:hypothetical protein
MRHLIAGIAVIVILLGVGATAVPPTEPLETWPPKLESFKPQTHGGHGTKLTIELGREKGKRRLIYKAEGWQVNPPNPPYEPGVFNTLYIETKYYFGKGEFLGLEQDFNEHGYGLFVSSSEHLPEPPKGTDKIVVEYRTVLWNQRGWTEKERGSWFTATWWHFTTAVTTKDGEVSRLSMAPVDHDLLGWMKAGKVPCEEGVSATAILDYTP